MQAQTKQADKAKQVGQLKYANVLSRERSMADFIPYSSHVTDNTVMTREGDFLRIWRIGGITFETEDPENIVLRKNQLNTLLKAIASEHVALWTHNVRRRVSERLHADFTNAFCRALDERYYQSFSGYHMMANELYLTLVYRPHPNRVARVVMRAGRRSLEDIRHEQQHAIDRLDELARQVEAGFRRYDIEPLTTWQDVAGVQYSHILSFLQFLVTAELQPVRVPTTPINTYIGNAWLFAGRDTIEIASPIRTRYAQLIDFKDYAAHTEPGLLNSLMYEEYEYIMTQSFSFIQKHAGKKFLEHQQMQLMNAGDGSATQIGQISDAIDQLIQNAFSMGEYHFSLAILGDSVADTSRNRVSAMTILNDMGFVATLCSISSDAAWYAQLPCNWRYRPRIARLTSLNFAGLSCFHNFMIGKRDGNPWGQAVTLMKTPSGQPLFINFHASREDEDVLDKKISGTVRIFGTTGTGKTVFLGVLLCQSQKFRADAPNGYTDVVFDCDHGTKIMVLALGGYYFSLRNGEPTGFNPFQMEPSEGNIIFLEKLVKKLVTGEGQSFTTMDEQRVSHAVRTVMRMPRQLRRLSTVIQNMTEGTEIGERENSVVKRLARWCQGGALGWVLDNPDDKLDFNTHGTYGFDGTDFLDNSTISVPIAMYLFHRMDDAMDGRRFVFYMDEFWKWLADDAFSDFVNNKLKTMRKRNALGVFATQSPADVLESDIAKTVVEQCATEIYLPNPRADFDDYVQKLKLTVAEFNIIKSFPEDSRLFLIKQGHRSAIGRLDLAGMEDELAVISGTTDNIELVERIIDEVGGDPVIWLPIFHEKRRQRMKFSASVAVERLAL